jgi:putative ABC transport system substrate-binding protein
VALASFLALPLAAEAQPPGKVSRVGFLSTVANPQTAYFFSAFTDGLREHGYVQGQNLLIERRYSEGKTERFPDLVAELVRLNVDVIVAPGTGPAVAAKRATSTIPIVTVLVGDPVGAGLAATLARPGANVTGMSSQAAELEGKWLQLLKEVSPKLSSVAVLWDSTNSAHATGFKRLETLGRSLSVQLHAFDVRARDDLDRALAALHARRPDALIPFDGQVTFAFRRLITDFAARNRLPAIYLWKTYVDDGGLMSYGPDLADLHRRAATYVARILKGARPGDLPIEQPTKFELAISVKTARALGLTVPQSVLLRADHIVD